MRTLLGRGLVRLLLFALMLVTAPAGADVPGSASGVRKRVLVLYSTRRNAQTAVTVDRELPRILGGGAQEGPDYYSEYLDLPRFRGQPYQSALADFLRLKYRQHTFDVVVAMSDESLEFIARNRDQLFPNVPVVFFATRPVTHHLEKSTGLVAELNLRDTLAMAIAMQPDVQQAFVVSGADDLDKGYERLAREQLRSLESLVTLTYLSGMPRNDLERRLAALPSHSIVYYLVVTRHGSGETVRTLDYLDRVVAVSTAPVYSWIDSAMGHGIVGGMLKSQEAETKALGTVARRVLGGEQADAIPISYADLNVGQVDWRALRRWGITEARVPGGSFVRFREPSMWESYKAYVLVALILLVAQTMLIGSLLVQRTKRREAEADASGSQAKLRETYDRIRDLGSRLLNAQEAERSRIARELHDDISQKLALLSIDLQLLLSRVVSSDQRNVVRLAREVQERVQAIAKSVHDISYTLHPTKLRMIGLVGAIDSLQRELSKPDISISFSHDAVPAALPPEVNLCLFRVAQEALRNAVRHSGAREISLDLHGDQSALTLTIADDGRGFDVGTAWGDGLGLISMCERVKSIGGTLTIHSQPGAGTDLEVVVPSAIRPNDRQQLVVS
jgi:signal transduction histidine kinase